MNVSGRLRGVTARFSVFVAQCMMRVFSSVLAGTFTLLESPLEIA
jgi:hypothetical protein